jgi:hypothetical protein
MRLIPQLHVLVSEPGQTGVRLKCIPARPLPWSKTMTCTTPEGVLRALMNFEWQELKPKSARADV